MGIWKGGGQGHRLGLEPAAMESFPGVGVLWCQPAALEHHGAVLHRCMAEVSGSACKWPGWEEPSGEQPPIVGSTSSADSKVNQMSEKGSSPCGFTTFLLLQVNIQK